jgi:hypothetical protein
LNQNILARPKQRGDTERRSWSVKRHGAAGFGRILQGFVGIQSLRICPKDLTIDGAQARC